MTVPSCQRDDRHQLHKIKILTTMVISSSSLQTFRRQLKTHLFNFHTSPDFLTVWPASLQ